MIHCERRGGVGCPFGKGFGVQGPTVYRSGAVIARSIIYILSARNITALISVVALTSGPSYCQTSDRSNAVVIDDVIASLAVVPDHDNDKIWSS